MGGMLKPRMTGLMLLNGGVQQYGDPTAIPKHKKTFAEDIHISDDGYLVKRPGKRPIGPRFFVDETLTQFGFTEVGDGLIEATEGLIEK